MHDRPVGSSVGAEGDSQIEQTNLVAQMAMIVQSVEALSSKFDEIYAVVEGLMSEGSELDRRTRQIRATTRRTERQLGDDLAAVKRRLGALDRNVAELGGRLEASETRLLATVETHRYHTQQELDQVVQALSRTEVPD